MRRGGLVFWAGLAALILLGALAPRLVANPYYVFAGYIVLQYVVVATAWNILGGYAGYINFGAAAFFGTGAYAAAGLFQAFAAPLLVQVVGAAVIGALLGLFTGYLTLRVQGVYFAIATLALVVVIETIVYNVPFLGGARGIPVLSPPVPAWFGTPVQFACFAMLLLAAAGIGMAWLIEKSWIGRGLRALRSSEAAAECAGVPTLRLKLLACALSGGLMAAAGAPYPTYASFVEPTAVFSLAIGLNAIAMPLIGGTRWWPGPVIGAILLGTVQQVATVTISSEVNILVIGLVLIGFVAAAPEGLIGLVSRRRAA